MKGVPRVIFLCSNGTGLGHVTRMLAIARQAKGRFESIFVSLAQAADIIQSYGFFAEYIPSYTLTLSNLRAWDEWLGIELCKLCRIYSPSLIVYDGNNPSPGILAPKLNEITPRAVWIRQGLMPDAPSPFLSHASFFDLVVEPGELAGMLDEGPTAALRESTYLADPIRSYDRDDYLSRTDARKALGIPENQIAILLQVGMGSNRDNVGLLDSILAALGAADDLFIGLLERNSAGIPLRRIWPSVHLITGHPIAPYLKAFDLCVSAAGYNAFHELIDACIPTIFVPNTHPTMDKQILRATFAQQAGAAIAWDFSDREVSKLVASRMLDQDVQRGFVEIMRRMETPNGACAVADRIAALAEDEGADFNKTRCAEPAEIVHYPADRKDRELQRLKRLVSLQYSLLHVPKGDTEGGNAAIEIGPPDPASLHEPVVRHELVLDGKNRPIGLMAPPGLACADLPAGSKTVLFNLFNAKPERLDELVDLVERQQQQASDFVPVFLTSNPSLTRFARRGYVAEYLNLCHGPDAAASKLEFLTGKWSATSVVDLSSRS